MQLKDELTMFIEELSIIINNLEKISCSYEDVMEIHDTVKSINVILYHSEILAFQNDYDLTDSRNYTSFFDEVKRIISLWNLSLSRRFGKAIDNESWEIYEYFKYVSADTIYEATVRHFNGISEEMKEVFLSLPQRYTFITGKIDYKKGDYSLIRQHVDMMSEKIEEYRWLYDHLEDYRSKYILNGIIQYWFGFDLNKLHNLTERTFFDYYDLDIVKCNKDEVMVDLGAYIGDSVIDFAKTYGGYKKIYAYEITASTFETLCVNTSNLENIVLRHKGVSSECGIMYISDGKSAAGNNLKNEGNVEIEVTTLDIDIEEPVTLIKMDIEGSEKEALQGARNHIVKEKPKLLISSYHLVSDIFDVPLLINEIRDDYKFYMRFDGCGIWPCDYVLYAV